ncbi:MAG TPA: discoidin domain-containing protein [Acidimicrobiia bacterium]|nr:discoidin domain-containing protein [Acidimicrobiia bacterium]
MAVKLRAVTTATNVDGTSASSITINKPTGTVEGDILILITNQYTGDTGMAGVTSQGFVLLDIIDEGTDLRSRAWKKVATSSEPASYTLNFAGAGGSVGATLAAFAGGYDVTTWANIVTGTDDPASGYDLDCARDSVGYQAYVWRNDTANTTVTWSFGSEVTDISSKATTAIRSGQSTMYYGPPDLEDIVNAGDELPAAEANPATAPLFGIFWNFLIGDKAPDNEAWDDTDLSTAVELKLDRVELDAVGSIDTRFACDFTGTVSAITATAESEPAAQAADGLPLTNWLDDTTVAPQALTYDFGASATPRAKRYRITSAATGSTYGATLDPMNWTVEGSNDGSSWTVIDTRENEAFGNRGDTREFRIADPGDYRYYKLNVSSNFGSASTVGVQLAEWRLSSVDVWEDITPFVNYDGKVRIVRGLQGTSGRSDYTRAYMTLKNTDGRFTVDNLGGAYHGALQRNNELRISRAYGTKSLQLQGAVRVEGTDMIGDCFRTPLAYSLQIASDLDVRLDLDMESWKAEQSLVGLGIDSSAPEVGWALYMGSDGKLHFTWVKSTGDVFDLKSTVAVPDAVRQSVRASFDANDGSGNSVVTFYTATTFNGTWVQLGEPVSVSTGGTDIAYAGGSLAIGHTGTRSPRGIHGRVYNFELRDTALGTTVADLDFTAMDNGSRTYTDSAGNLWIALNYAVVSNRRYRFHGEVATWPIAWDTTGNWVQADITAAGVQKRLERGGAAGSVMYRHHTRGIVENPGFDFQRGQAVGYWPMEDKKDSYQCASALTGKPHLEIYGNPKFEEFTDFRESDALPDLNGAKFGARVVGAADGYVDCRFIMDIPADATITTGANLITLWGNGTQAKFQLHVGNSTEWDWHFYTEAALETGTPSHVSAAIPVTVVGERFHVRVQLQQVGADIFIAVELMSVYGESLGSSVQSVAGQTFGRIYRVQVNDAEAVRNTGIGMGHLAIYGTEFPTWTDPINAHHYELAASRIERICNEEGIEYRLVGGAAGSQFMGYQTPGSVQEIMSSAAVSDSGYLTDPLDAFGIEFRTDRSVMSRAARLSLSYTGNELSNELRPTQDDAHLVNDFEARRGDAGSSRFVLTEGKLSVQAPPHGVGPYSAEQSYSLAHEGQCVDIASWQVHQGTLDEERFPRIIVALENARIAASPALIEAILNLDIGYRVDVYDTPSFLPARDIRQLVIGYEEIFDQFQHENRMNTIPERAFEVASYSSGYRFDTSGSELYQDITDTATSIKVSTTNGPEWTVDPEAIPIDLDVDGEQMRVSAVGRLISSNPFFDTDITGWTNDTGSDVVAWSQDYVHFYEQAEASMKLTPDGVSSFADGVNTASAVGTVVPLEQYEMSAWVYTPTGSTNVSVSVFWRTSGNVFISTGTGTDRTIPAGVWTHISETFQAPATASRAQARVRVGGTPAAGNITYWYSARLVEKSEDPAYTFDSFNRADSTTNLGSTDDGVIQAWTQHSGTWGINGNAAYISAAATSVATIAGTADFERCEVTMSSFASGSASIVFRAIDQNTRCRFGGTVGTTPDLVFRVGGVDTRTEPASGYTLAAGDKLGIRAQGSVVQAFINDILVLTVSETDNMAETRVGMLVTTTVPRFNNFSFDPGTGPQTLTVERGINGVTAHHNQGAEVELWRPPYRGL